MWWFILGSRHGAGGAGATVGAWTQLSETVGPGGWSCEPEPSHTESGRSEQELTTDAKMQVESHWQVFGSGWCEHASWVQEWLGGGDVRGTILEILTERRGRMECVGQMWESKWRGLGECGEVRRVQETERQRSRTSRLLQVLVAEPRQRLPGAFHHSVACGIRDMLTAAVWKYRPHENQTVRSQETQIWHPQPASDSWTCKRPSCLGKEPEERWEAQPTAGAGPWAE